MNLNVAKPIDSINFNFRLTEIRSGIMVLNARVKNVYLLMVSGGKLVFGKVLVLT